MSEKVIIIGGGPNGLVAAALLAKAGRGVVLLEASDRLGGLARAEEIVPGFEAPGLHHDVSLVRPWVLAKLGLNLPKSRRPDLILPAADGKEFVVPPDGTGSGGIGGASTGDNSAWQAFRAFIDKVRPAILRLFDRSPLSVRDSLWTLARTGWSVRKLGADTMMELMRVAPMSVADWMQDAFHDERLRAGLALGALEGMFTGPRSAHTGMNLLVREAMAGDEIQGGGPAVVRALEGVARAAGAELRTSAKVEKILVDRQGVAGVKVSGEVIQGRVVLSTIDPKRTFATLIGPPWLPLEMAKAADVYRMRGTTAVLRLALSKPLVTAAGTTVGHLRTGATLDEVERAFDASKYRRFATKPVLDVRVSGAEGKTVASVRVQAAPYDLEGGWTDAARSALVEAALVVLDDACPGARGSVAAMELLVPPDIEARYGLSGGHLLHGEHAPDQLLSFRPSLSSGRYATSIPGLFIGGGSSHPGGGLTLAPGALAVNALSA